MEAYCRSKVADGRYSFPCPDPNCNKIWEFSLVRHVACLDSETRKQIEKKVTDNYIRQGFRNQQCPGCQTWCIPIDEGDICVRCPVCSKNKSRPYDFCWACKQQWKGTGVRYCGNKGCDGKDPRIKVLHSAAENWITIDNLPGCPSTRACPKCGLLINHVGGCRRMTCTSCGAEFCFICLRRWNKSYNDYPPACQYRIAPVQEVLSDPLWDDPIDDDLCPTPASTPTPAPVTTATARRATNSDGCVII